MPYEMKLVGGLGYLDNEFRDPMATPPTPDALARLSGKARLDPHPNQLFDIGVGHVADVGKGTVPDFRARRYDFETWVQYLDFGMNVVDLVLETSCDQEPISVQRVDIHLLGSVVERRYFSCS